MTTHNEIPEDLSSTEPVGLNLEGVPQPFAGAIVLLETIAQTGATSFIDGKPTPNRELCLRFASELRAALRPSTLTLVATDSDAWLEEFARLLGNYVQVCKQEAPETRHHYHVLYDHVRALVPSAPERTLRYWLEVIHDNGLSLGDRLQRISSRISSILRGDSPDKYPPHQIREQCTCHLSE